MSSRNRGQSMSSNYGISADDLSEFVKNRDQGGKEALVESKYGSLEELAKKLRTDLKNGLDKSEEQNDFKERTDAFGTNTLPEKDARGFFSFLWDALKDKTLIILIVASVVSIVLGVTMPPPGEDRKTGWIEGTAILVAVAAVSIVTAGNDFSKEKRFKQLSEMNEDRKIKVIRGGEQKVISTHKVVVGDIISLETGDFIPADLYYIKGQNISVDESAMTGEPEAVHKTPEDPFFLSGCMVMEGVAKGLVIATGTKSQWGQIKATLQKEETQTPLQTKLEDLAESIGKIGVGAAIITFIALILQWSIKTFAIDKKKWKWDELGILVRFLITSITIIVVAVPEGLPLAVTLALAYSMMKMMKDQNLVRHLAACETMGGANAICSDKTGTLTQNRMKVVKLWLSGETFDKAPKEKSEIKNEEAFKMFTEGICINSSAYIEKIDSDKPDFIGAKTECALLLLSHKLGVEYGEVREQLHVERLYPFTSKKKRMSTLVKTDQGFRLHCKGASEVLLELSTKRMGDDGHETDLGEDEKAKLLEQIQDWASQGLRTLCLCYADHPSSLNVPKDDEEGALDKDLTLVAIVAIEDPLRPEVKDSVRQCQKAGITIRMLTGDNLLTAKSIGKQCGILTEGGIAIEGPKFRKLSEREIDDLIPKLQIIARCSPEDKLILVKRLRELGGVVAVTGDGTNDAPALREADVGFAMGISGTEVAKDASDIILLDDNFSSIEKAVLWGRNVYDSIRKFVQFQLTVNIVAVIVAFVGAVTAGDSPLKPVQLLWVNLIMDTMAALALATEPPQPELLDRPPYGRFSSLITWKMWRNIVGQATFQLGVLFFILYGAHLIPYIGVPAKPIDGDLRTTILFNTFVFCQLFNEINSRKLGDEKNVFVHFFDNWIFIAILVFTATVQALLVQFGGNFASTVGLNLYQWIFCLGVAFISIPWGIIVRCIPVPEEARGEEAAVVGQKKGTEREPLLPPSDMEEGRKRTAKDNWQTAGSVVPAISVISAFRGGRSRTRGFSTSKYDMRASGSSASGPSALSRRMSVNMTK